VLGTLVEWYQLRISIFSESETEVHRQVLVSLRASTMCWPAKILFCYLVFPPSNYEGISTCKVLDQKVFRLDKTQKNPTSQVFGLPNEVG